MDTIDINILFFGSLKTYFGDNLSMSISKGTQLVNILDILKQKAPESIAELSYCKIAVDSVMENENYIIEKSSEIAILPPFSGG